MCGRYVQKRAPLDLAKDWSPRGLYRPPRYEQLKLPIFNIAPTQPAVAVRADDITIMRWGLVPSWADDVKIGARMINARAETAAMKPAYRAAFKRRHCVIPADGFYEWRAAEQPKGAKQPFYIHWANDQVRGFAGLWESWRDELDTFTILTCEPNARMAKVHNRMPVILDAEGVERWLDPDLPPDDAQAMMRPCLDDWLTMYPVSTHVNSPRHDDERCIEPVD